MRIAFETLDGLRVVEDCPEIEDDAERIMRPIWRGVPSWEAEDERQFKGKDIPDSFLRYRVYERDMKVWGGAVVFKEVPC